MTDTDRDESGDRSYDDMSSNALADHLEAVAFDDNRHEEDDPHVMLAAARQALEAQDDRE